MTLRLSEAIRLGSLLHPQCFNVFYRREWGENEGRYITVSTCAIGAALVAIGAEPVGLVNVVNVNFEYPAEWMIHAFCPVCRDDTGRFPIVQLATHLNDGHHWTREAIASWVKSIEREQLPEQQVEALEAVLV